MGLEWILKLNIVIVSLYVYKAGRDCSVKFCETCSETNPAFCDTCESSYILNSDKSSCTRNATLSCQADHCSVCKDANNTNCETCNSGYKPNNFFKCEAQLCNDAYCEVCKTDKNACTACKAGYYFVKGKLDFCTNKCDRSYCALCNDKEECLTCVAGATYNSAEKSCEPPIDPHGSRKGVRDCELKFCDVCVEGNSKKCETCENHYQKKDDGTCIRNNTLDRNCTIPHCDTCQTVGDQVVCSSCNPGYSKNNVNVCVPNICNDIHCIDCKEDKNICSACTRGFYTVDKTLSFCTNKCDRNYCASCDYFNGEPRCNKCYEGLTRNNETFSCNPDNHDDEHDHGVSLGLFIGVAIACVIVAVIFTYILTKLCCSRPDSEKLVESNDQSSVQMSRA